MPHQEAREPMEDSSSDTTPRGAPDNAVGAGGQPQTGPTERLSWMRLLVLLVVLVLVGAGIYVGSRHLSSSSPAVDRSWSVPYVDVTLTPTYQFQNPESNPARDIALAFVVADPKHPCTASWGGSYTLDTAASELELDRRITQLRAAGGDVMISFGGQANAELALACSDRGKLTTVYRDVITRYDVKAVDFDIENADLTDQASIERRAAAVATIQKERKAAGHPLDVWLTVPVSTDGMSAEVQALVTATLQGGVELTGVNVMTMNFGTVADPITNMLPATKKALEASAGQLAAVYSAEGVTLDESQRWAKLGATPMIGQNDVVGEVFTLDDARGLADFAMSKGLGRVSTWSLNRDGPCGASFSDVMVLSNNCSSVEQKALEYAGVFTVLPGRTPSLPQGQQVTVTEPPLVVDNPTTSPYPIWRPDGQYPGGYKVVSQGKVYEAKWYTQGSQPGMLVANPWDSPWALIGPVSPDDQPFTPSTVAEGTHPDWSPTELYAKGDKVLFDGLPYEARWPNQGEAPSSLFPVGPNSAWQPLFTLPGEPAGS